MNHLKQQIFDFFRYVLQRTGKTCRILFTMIIPISIVIRVIQELGVLPYVSAVVEPLMTCCGLPAETAFVWISALVVNIYGGILALFTIYPSLSEPLTVAQLTVLLSMILVAHTFPLELKIAQKAGAKLGFMLLFRLGCGWAFGMLLSWLYSGFGWLQEPVQFSQMVLKDAHLSWGAWAVNELKNYAIIVVVIFALVATLRILELTGLIRWLNKAMHPLLRWLGISDEVLPITIIGLTLGIAYGGGLIIEESRQKHLPTKDILYSLVLMGLFHSIIEDTLLMISIGGHYSGVFVLRLLFSVVITYFFVLLTKNMPEEQFCRWFMTRRTSV